ncbi:MAG: hypothetical protein A2Z99_05290 [Treponema sp. GWB1_62_6]|nr:MAG: hypothetical protein A2Z99_05290 [Treponema sp. GWB1_62_6]
MDAAATFDRLVAELPVDERREFLSRLEALGTLSSAPLFAEENLSERVELEKRFGECSWYYRLYLGIMSTFKGKPAIKVFEDRLIGKLSVRIETRYPGIYDNRRGAFLAGFRDELLSLKDSARFFYEALDGSVGRDRAAFFAFLASIEFDFLHSRFETEADPYAIAEASPGFSESEVRVQANRALESILQSIDDDQRRRMYRNVRSLSCLREIASFLFDRVLSSFSGTAPAALLPSAGTNCPAYLILDQLKVLNDALFSFDFPPSMTLMESVFLFDLQEKMGERDFDMMGETRKMLEQAEEALGRIRAFNKRLPLTAIIRCASRDLEYVPQAVTGGEDWFPVFRDFWRKKMEDRFLSFVHDRRLSQLAEALGTYFRGKDVPPLEHAVPPSAKYRKELGPDLIVIRSAFALRFLAGFYSTVFLGEINRALKPVLIDGEFYKRENRTEFTDAYNEILKLGDAVRLFDSRLGPQGDLGSRWEAAQKEMAQVAVKRRRLLAVAKEIDDEAGLVVGRAVKAMRSLQSILAGIISGEAGGRYDSLANLGALSGRSGSFIPILENALQRIEKAVQLLGEIEAAEFDR